MQGAVSLPFANRMSNLQFSAIFSPLGNSLSPRYSRNSAFSSNDCRNQSRSSGISETCLLIQERQKNNVAQGFSIHADVRCKSATTSGLGGIVAVQASILRLIEAQSSVSEDNPGSESIPPIPLATI
jgi:hypothetical protein